MNQLQVAAETLNNLQKKLNAVLEKLAAMFAASLQKSIHEAMSQLGTKLQTIKGNQVPKDQARCSTSKLCPSTFPERPISGRGESVTM